MLFPLLYVACIPRSYPSYLCCRLQGLFVVAGRTSGRANGALDSSAIYEHRLSSPTLPALFGRRRS